MSRVLPILFNTDMVQAILEGRKTVTRRIIKKSQCILADKKEPFELKKDNLHAPWCDMTDAEYIAATYRPPFCAGDILYVRETWGIMRAKRFDAMAEIRFKAGGKNKTIYFPNGGTDNTDRTEYDEFLRKWDKTSNFIWHPSIHMPKKAARIWLNVTDVRVERLQDITEDGALKEGVYPSNCRDCISKLDCDTCPDEGYDEIDNLIEIWDSTIKKSDVSLYSWDANPWVWVIEFERYEKPEGR